MRYRLSSATSKGDNFNRSDLVTCTADKQGGQEKDNQGYVLASRQRERLDGIGLKALQPGLNRLRFKADETVNAPAGNLVL